MTRKPQLSLKQLEAFVAVSDLGSFSRAADKLNTTQPNISARIVGLENVLGAKLMERDAGSVRLTTRGRDLLEYARQVLRAKDRLVDASDHSAHISGTLSLGVTEIIVHTWLREFLRTLRQRFPNLTVEITVDISVSIEDELFDRSVDLAFQNEPFRRRISGMQDLGTYPMMWVASPEIAAELPAQPKIDDLAGHTILTHSRGTQIFEEINTHFQTVSNLRFAVSSSSNIAACTHMAVEGMGVAVLPAHMIEAELASGALTQINYAWTPEPLQFFARYDQDRSPLFVAQAAEVAGEVAKRFLIRRP